MPIWCRIRGSKRTRRASPRSGLRGRRAPLSPRTPIRSTLPGGRALRLRSRGYHSFGKWIAQVAKIEARKTYRFDVLYRPEAYENEQVSVDAILSWCRDAACSFVRAARLRGPHGSGRRRLAPAARANSVLPMRPWPCASNSVCASPNTARCSWSRPRADGSGRDAASHGAHRHHARGRISAHAQGEPGADRHA